MIEVGSKGAKGSQCPAKQANVATEMTRVPRPVGVVYKGCTRNALSLCRLLLKPEQGLHFWQRLTYAGKGGRDAQALLHVYHEIFD